MITKNGIIEIEDFCFFIGDVPILRDVTLTIERGDYLSIVGPNGAGKTTLLRCIDKVFTGGTGSLKIKGMPVDSYTQGTLARLVSYVPQADPTRLPFTVHEFVMMARYPHLSPFSSVTSEDEHIVGEAMLRTGIEKFRDRLLGSLSSGERQKVFIAAALAQETEIILLDEPTTFLDYRHQLEVGGLLARINRESGTTIVSVTHDINSAALVSSRIAALKAGRVVFCGTPEELMKNEVLEDIYGKAFLFTSHPQKGIPIVVPEEPPA
jgi:iron complex transport system ATP-binding protein